MKLKHIALLAALLPAAAGSAWAGAGPPGHHHDDSAAFGKPGDPKKPSRIVKIQMLDEYGTGLFSPDVIQVKQGEQIKFMISNDGERAHEMILATLKMNLAHAQEMKKNPDMEHDDPNGKRLLPKQSAEILWQFTKAGEFDFSCLIPGHREAGMHGKVVVSAKTASK